MKRVDGGGDIKQGSESTRSGPFLCLEQSRNAGKLTGVCFVVPDEPLGQKPDNQS